MTDRSPWRGVAGAVLAVAVLTSAGCTSVPVAEADQLSADSPSVDESAFDWRAHDGESITVLANDMVYVPLLQDRLADFMSLTGISVLLETMPEDQLLARLGTRVGGGQEIDVFTTAGQIHGEYFARRGLYADLAPLAADAARTSPSWHRESFLPDVYDSLAFDGVQTAVPINLAVQVLYYRTDVLDELGLTPPSTMEEFAAAVAAADELDGIAGYASRADGASAVPMSTHFVHTFGGRWFDDDGRPSFTSPAAMDGLDTYAGLLRDHGPDDLEGASIDDIRASFAAGDAAFYTDSSAFIGVLTDPEQSAIADHVGVAPMPVADDEVGTFFNWALAINARSEKTDASWLFLQWATSEGVSQELTDEGWVSARAEQSLPERSLPGDWIDSYETTVARPQLVPFTPPAANAQEVQDVIGEGLTRLIHAGDREAVPAAEEAVAAIVDR